VDSSSHFELTVENVVQLSAKASKNVPPFSPPEKWKSFWNCEVGTVSIGPKLKSDDFYFTMRRACLSLLLTFQTFGIQFFYT